MADNERKINQKINTEIKKYEILKKAFLKLHESESKASKTRRDNFEKLNGIQEYDNTELKDIYNLFVNEMKSLEDKRNAHLAKIMDLILPVVDYYPEKLKITKKTLEDLSKIRKNKQKLEKSRNETKNQNVSEIQRINGELAKSRNEESKKEITLENEMVKFESERVDDNKLLFLHFIHSELKYHATALEKISDLFYKINGKDPREFLEEFAQKLKIEVDFNELGIDIEKIKESRQKKESQENKEKDEVYGDDEEEDIKASVEKSQIKKSQKSKNNVTNKILDSQLDDLE